MYQVRTAQPVGTRSAAYSLYVVDYETGKQLLLLENVADSDTWRPSIDRNEIRYYMVNETTIDGGATAPGVPSAVATLVRYDLTRGPIEEIPNVASYAVMPDGSSGITAEVLAGQRLPVLHFRFADGTDRVLGAAPDRCRARASGACTGWAARTVRSAFCRTPPPRSPRTSARTSRASCSMRTRPGPCSR
jgi:hypothetical protein